MVWFNFYDFRLIVSARFQHYSGNWIIEDVICTVEIDGPPFLVIVIMVVKVYDMFSSAKIKSYIR